MQVNESNQNNKAKYKFLFYFNLIDGLQVDYSWASSMLEHHINHLSLIYISLAAVDVTTMY